MKRQKRRMPSVISGLFLGCVFVVMLSMVSQFGLIQSNENTLKNKEITAVPGHWLKTDKDGNYVPPSLEKNKITKNTIFRQATQISMEEALTELNKETDTLNIMYIWTDVHKLNVISVTSFNKKTRQAAIVVIPLQTVIYNENTVKLNRPYKTIAQLYQEQGREGVRRFLQNKFQIHIPYFVHVNQSALQKLSNIIGVLNVNGDSITMLEAFEQTAAGIRTDDRDVVRAVAGKVLQPGIIFDVPTIIDIFTQDINTNMSVQEMIKIFYLSRKLNLSYMRKTSLPGYEDFLDNQKMLFVSDNTWKNIIFNITK